MHAPERIRDQLRRVLRPRAGLPAPAAVGARVRLRARHDVGLPRALHSGRFARHLHRAGAHARGDLREERAAAPADAARLQRVRPRERSLHARSDRAASIRSRPFARSRRTFGVAPAPAADRRALRRDAQVPRLHGGPTPFSLGAARAGRHGPRTRIDEEQNVVAPGIREARLDLSAEPHASPREGRGPRAALRPGAQHGGHGPRAAGRGPRRRLALRRSGLRPLPVKVQWLRIPHD
mmetsp:Transcript_17575/g.53502  ORF Transcript_17575/g.53502 Transcript_17575/m.53502 type:complete len:237 (+) Transcript_17575:1264-1974(+)